MVLRTQVGFPPASLQAVFHIGAPRKGSVEHLVLAEGGIVFASATPAVLSAVPGTPAQYRLEATLAASDGTGLGIHGRLDGVAGPNPTLTLVSTEPYPGMASVTTGKSFPPEMLAGTLAVTLQTGKIRATLASDAARSGQLMGTLVLDCVKAIESTAPGSAGTTGTTMPNGAFTSDSNFSSPFCHEFRTAFQP